MAGSGVIILTGVGNPDGPHTIEFNDEPPMASDIGYNNTISHLTADNMQGAIDEVNTKVVNAGLININDIVITATGATSLYSSVQVVNGVLCGVAGCVFPTAQSIVLNINYNVSGLLGLFTRIGSTYITTDTLSFTNGVSTITSAGGAGDVVHLTFSQKWNPSWTKKEST